MATTQIELPDVLMRLRQYCDERSICADTIELRIADHRQYEMLRHCLARELSPISCMGLGKPTAGDRMMLCGFKIIYQP